VVLELELSKIDADLISDIKGIDGVISVDQVERKLYVHMREDKSGDVSQMIIKHGATILLMRPKERSLEEIFIEYYKEGA
jgi:hypothetical protein